MLDCVLRMLDCVLRMLSGWMVDVELYAENVGLCAKNALWMDGWLVA